MTVYQMKQCHDDFYLQGGDTQSKTTVSIDRICKLQDPCNSLHDACRISEMIFFLAAAASCEAWYSYERHATLEKFGRC